MPTARFQPSFAAGVLGPGLHGRVDIAKYDVGLRIGRNVFVHAHGGISNRAGTRFVGQVMDQTKPHRLIPFDRDGVDSAVLLLGENQMKVIEDAAFVQDGGSDYVAVTPYTAAQAMTLNYVQSIDVVFTAHRAVYPQRMERQSATSFVFSNIAVDPTVAVPAQPTVAAKTTEAGGETYRYAVSAVVDGVEGFASTVGAVVDAAPLRNAGEQNTISWTSTGADEYQIYKERNGVLGFIGFTSDTSFVDDNIDADLTSTPREPAGVFETVDDYPGAVTLFQQRLLFGGSVARPETLYGSKIGDFSDFTRARSLRADDRIELDLTGRTLNTIQSMINIRELLIFTGTGEFAITGPEGALPADNPIQTQYGYSGSTRLPPLLVEDTALFVDRTGQTVRDLRYAFEQDGYSGNDLTIFASHFFEGRAIVDWAYAKNPFSIVWAVTDDGGLYSLTYKREQQVWAWTEHDVSGDVESICVVPEGRRDAVYLTVKRIVQGAVRRYVERMEDRTFFVDCGIRFTSAEPVTTVSGLDHLEGLTVVAVADGDVFDDLIVSGGSVTIPRAGTEFVVGLRYTAEAETLPAAVQAAELGDMRGRPHRVSKVRVQVENTRGLAISAGDAVPTEMKATGPDLSRPIKTKTGMIEIVTRPNWDRDGTVRMVQAYPLPMTVLGVSPEMSIGRTS